MAHNFYHLIHHPDNESIHLHLNRWRRKSWRFFRHHPWAAALLLFSAILLFGYLFQPRTNATDHLTRAKSFVTLGKTSAAIIELKNAIEKEPENTEAYAILGKTYYKLGRSKEALRSFSLAKRYGLTSEPIALPYAETFINEGLYQEAIKELDRLPEPLTNSSGSLILKGLAYLGMDALSDARTAFSSVLQQEASLLKVDLVKAHLGLGMVAIREENRIAHTSSMHKQTGLRQTEPRQQKKDFTAAKQYLQQALRINPHHVIANYILAHLYYGEGAAKSAYNPLLMGLKNDPVHAPSLLLMAVINYQEGYFKLVDKYLERYSKLYRRQVPTLKLLSAIKLKLALPHVAIELLRPLEQEGVVDAQLFTLLGNAYIAMDELSMAAEYLTKASVLEKNNDRAPTLLELNHPLPNLTQWVLGTTEKSIHFQKSLFQEEIIQILDHVRNKNFGAALSAAKDFSERTQNNAMAYHLLGICYIGKKMPYDARRQFEKALRINPGFTPAATRLAQLNLRATNN